MSDKGDIHELAVGWITERKGTPVPGFLKLTYVGFCLFGLVIGVWADGWEKLNIVPALIVAPLAFLGGSFYSINMLPPLWQKITLLNPVVYLVSGFRWSFYGVSDVSVGISLGMTAVFMLLCLDGRIEHRQAGSQADSDTLDCIAPGNVVFLFSHYFPLALDLTGQSARPFRLMMNDQAADLFHSVRLSLPGNSWREDTQSRKTAQLRSIAGKLAGTIGDRHAG